MTDHTDHTDHAVFEPARRGDPRRPLPRPTRSGHRRHPDPRPRGRRGAHHRNGHGYTSPSIPGLAVIAFPGPEIGAVPTHWSDTHIASGRSLCMPGDRFKSAVVAAALAGEKLDWSKVGTDGGRAVYADPTVDFASRTRALWGSTFAPSWVLGEPDIDLDDDEDGIDWAAYYDSRSARYSTGAHEAQPGWGPPQPDPRPTHGQWALVKGTAQSRALLGGGRGYRGCDGELPRLRRRLLPAGPARAGRSVVLGALPPRHLAPYPPAMRRLREDAPPDASLVPMLTEAGIRRAGISEDDLRALGP